MTKRRQPEAIPDFDPVLRPLVDEGLLERRETPEGPLFRVSAAGEAEVDRMGDPAAQEADRRLVLCLLYVAQFGIRDGDLPKHLGALGWPRVRIEAVLADLEKRGLVRLEAPEGGTPC